MSQYEYYEFQAVDRPLTVAEMRELRGYSSRAQITPTGFSVDYSWGSFKGDEDAWMERYFDAFLYLANWGTRVLKLRLPARLLDPEVAEAYFGGEVAAIRRTADHIVLSFVLEDDEGYEWIEAEGVLASLVSVRAELAHGDLRALYLAWLLQAQRGELDDDEPEPPVPPGLGQLSVSLQSLAEFLQIDDNLLAICAEASAPLDDRGLDRDAVRAWIGRLAAGEKDDILTSLVADGDHTRVLELQRRFQAERSARTGTPASRARTVGELLEAAEAHADERARIAAEERAREKARRAREAKTAREKHLDSLVGSEGRLWAQIDSFIATKQPKGYDQTVKLLVDLRDLAARTGGGDFELRLADLRMTHARKPSFLERLQKAGL